MTRRTLFVAAVTVVVLTLAATALAVLPKATLKLTAPAAVGVRAAENATVTVAGILKPKHSVTKLRYTKLYFYRSHQGAWRLWSVKNAKNVNAATYTTYSLIARIPYNGSWRVRAYHKDAGHRASWSAYRNITITGPAKAVPTGTGCWSSCH